jgi:hypothetical protein
VEHFAYLAVNIPWVFQASQIGAGWLAIRIRGDRRLQSFPCCFQVAGSGRQGPKVIQNQGPQPVVGSTLAEMLVGGHRRLELALLNQLAGPFVGRLAAPTASCCALKT